MKREVVGCTGGGGNHLRWLLLLSPEFSYFRDHAPDNFTFIKQCVYPNNRNWQNWLNFEWRWRLKVDQLITFSHLRPLQSDTKYCALITDPDLALKHYLKFNSNLNNTLIDTFKYQVIIYNDSVKKQSDKNNLIVINSETLLQPELDQDLYNKVVNWFSITNCYNQAKEIHLLWWQLVKRAEKDIITDLQKIYNDKSI